MNSEDYELFWERNASNEQLAHFRDFTDSLIAGMADDGYIQRPSSTYWQVLREIERRQLLAAVANDTTAHNPKRL